MQRGGRWMSRPTAEKQQEGLPDMRPSTAAASMAVESLHLYLGHWPGLTPGLTQVAQPHLWIWTGHKLSVRLETKIISLWHLVTACHLVSVAKEAVKMNMVAASNKCLHVNCKPRAAAKAVNTGLEPSICSVTHNQAGKVSGLLCHCREQQQGSGQALGRLPHQVQQQDEQGTTTMSWQQMTLEEHAFPSHSGPVGQPGLHLHTSFWLKSP